MGNLTNYQDFLNSQCAHCSLTLDCEDNKMIKILNSNNFEKPYLLDNELTNFEAIALIYGMSHRTLADKLLNNFKTLENVLEDEEYILSSEETTNDKHSTLVAARQNLTFCNECALLFTEMYRINRKFRNLSNENSLLSKTLYEQFSNLYQHLSVDVEWEMKTEFQNEPSEDCGEDPLMTEKNSIESNDYDSNLQNIKEECNSEGESATCDDMELSETDVVPENLVFVNSRSGETEGKVRKRKQDLKSMRKFMIVLDKLPENSIINSKSFSSKEFCANVQEDRLKERYSLRRKTQCINKVQELSDGDENLSDNGKSSSHFVESESESEVKDKEDIRVKKTKPIRRKADDDFGDIKVMHTKKRKKSDASQLYTPIPIETGTAMSQKYNYVCNECGNRFPSIIAIRFHLLSHTKDGDMTVYPKMINGPPYQCPKCSKKYNQNLSLKMHCLKWHNLKLLSRVKTNENNTPERSCHYCSECGLTFDRINSLCSHYRMKHNICLYSCLKCDKGFLLKKEWLSHKPNCHELKSCPENPVESHDFADNNDMAGVEEGEKEKPINICEKKEQSRENHTQEIICKTCGLTFREMRHLKHHKMNHHPKIRIYPGIIDGPPYKCPECDEKYKDLSNLEDHCVIKHNLQLQRLRMQTPAFLKCEECVLDFENVRSFVAHHQTKHNKNYFPCLSCSEIFEDESELEIHKNTKHSEIINESLDLEREEKDSSGEDEVEICEEPFFCRECGFSFKTSAAIATHNRIHQSHKKFDCKHCDESFKNAMSVLHHLSSVHKEFARPELYKDNYWCTDCDNEAFDSFPALKQHFQELNHYSFQITCAFCEKQFLNKKELQLHKKSAHAKKVKLSRGNERYDCPFCDENFPTMKEQFKHKSTHPKEEQLYKCPQCPNIYTSSNSFRAHRDMIHSGEKFQCEDCGRRIAGIRQYRAHCKRHAEKASGIMKLCDLCGKSFSTQKQLVKHKYVFHTRKEETQCQICGYVSRTKYYFKRHMKVHEKNGIVKKRKRKENV